MVITYWHNTNHLGYRHETLRQDVGQDDCGLDILNKKQRVLGIYNIYLNLVTNFIQMELYFL